jgi:hypothetical protein
VRKREGARVGREEGSGCPIYRERASGEERETAAGH